MNYQQIKKMVDEAVAMGCREWYLDGGEPMVRPDFLEIYTMFSKKGLRIQMSTNGTLITPQIARALKKYPCLLMVSLYGMNKEVHETVTRIPGSYALTMRGMSYLTEKKVPFTKQFMPIKTNMHHLKMFWKVPGRKKLGGSWLFLRQELKDPKENDSILNQRISPSLVAQIQPPAKYNVELNKKRGLGKKKLSGRYPLFQDGCPAGVTSFHVSAHGKLQMCSHMSKPEMTYDLKTGSFTYGWDMFLPGLRRKMMPAALECLDCSNRVFCDWCVAKSWRENHRLYGRVDYLCQIAKARKVLFKKMIRPCGSLKSARKAIFAE